MVQPTLATSLLCQAGVVLSCCSPCGGQSILPEVNHQPESRVREIRQHGSEGGASGNRTFLPLSKRSWCQEISEFEVYIKLWGQYPQQSQSDHSHYFCPGLPSRFALFPLLAISAKVFPVTSPLGEAIEVGTASVTSLFPSSLVLNGPVK